MSKLASDASLRYEGSVRETSIYSLQAPGLLSRYFVLSNPHSRPLLCSPEVIGYDCPLALLPSTTDAFSYLQLSDKEGVFDILTILRGGLNYPLEQAAWQKGLRLGDMHFLSCERVIKDKQILGLEIKYFKVRPTSGHTLMIGDILATGDTFIKCFTAFMEEFHRMGGSIRRVIFFTIGGTRAIDRLEQMTPRFRELFPGFEGFDCFFYEGIFTVYTDKGASGINVPDIDFGCKGGAVAPEMRLALVSNPAHLLEKCIIYDGGARRYEIPVHCDEVLEYWEGILNRADIIDTCALVAEKLGYDAPLPYDRWLQALHLEGDDGLLHRLWQAETRLLETAGTLDLRNISRERIKTISNIKKEYE